MSLSASRAVKYPKIVWLFLRNSLMSQIEYRFEFISWALVSTAWISLTLLIVNLLFGQVSSVAGWTKDQVLIVVCLDGIFTSLLWMFCVPSLVELSEGIRRGNLDFLLLKPVPDRFLVSVNKYDLDNFVRVLFLIFYLLFVIGVAHYSLSIISVLLFIVTISLGLVIFYNLFFIIATMSFWIIDFTNMEDVFSNITNTGRYPTQIFSEPLKSVFFYIIPVAFIATFPAQFLIGKDNPSLPLIALLLALLTSILSQQFWNFALKKYSSASS